jgi:GNAT superfamily N-acetyltransferase
VTVATALADYPKTVVLRDGAHLVLRPAVAGEAGALEAPAAPADALRLVALDGARVAGLLVLAPGAQEGERRVLVRLADGYRGRRLGTWMLLDAVHLATALGASRLVAEPADDAGLAAALLRLDFVPDGGGRMVKRLHAGWTDF